MGKKYKNRARDPLTVPFRQLKRISITLDTLLRSKLGFEAKPLSNPEPVEREDCIEFLQRVVEQSEQANHRK